MRKKHYSILFCYTLLFVFLFASFFRAAASESETQPQTIPDDGRKITVIYRESAEMTYECTYSDRLFSENAETENKELAMLSVLAAASMSQGEEDENYSAKMLEDCGFIVKGGFLFSKDGKEDSHSTSDDYDHARVQFGHKTITGEDGQSLLVALFINGYSEGGYEWVSNFNVGSGMYHAGFEKAALEIVDLTRTYVENIQEEAGKTLPVKYWVTGHSRGAAITNIVAEKLSEDGGEGVYAFGFATPRYTRDLLKSHKNIRNYINRSDMVPMTVPSYWGFFRNGMRGDRMFSATAAFREKFRELTNEEFQGSSAGEAAKIMARLFFVAPTQAAYNMPHTYYIGQEKYRFSHSELFQALSRRAIMDYEQYINDPEKLPEEESMQEMNELLSSFMDHVISDNHRISTYIVGVSLM